MTATDEAEDLGAWRVGTWLKGKYFLESVLGSGGMATVYAARHRNKKRFAVKMLHAEFSGRNDARTRFLREGYVANSVEHPGAVAVLDDDIAEDGAAFLVMELLQGASVEAIAEADGGRLPLDVVLAIALQTLDVLAAAHDKSVVHRDIKPANLFLTRDGRIKVLDYGIARLREHEGSATLAGTTLGTPAFMAPEQAAGTVSLIDGRSDLWSLGATMFTLLTGQSVHEGETLQHLMVLAATESPRSILSVLPQLPRQAAFVIDRALAFDRGGRWESAFAMREAVCDSFEAIFGALLTAAPLVALADRSIPPSVRFDTPSHDFEASGATALAPRVAERPGGQLATIVGSSNLITGQPVSHPPPPLAASSSYRWIGVVVGLVTLLTVATAVSLGSRSAASTQPVSSASPAESAAPGSQSSNGTVAAPPPTGAPVDDTPPAASAARPQQPLPSAAPSPHPPAASSARPPNRRSPPPNGKAVGSPAPPVTNDFDRQ